MNGTLASSNTGIIAIVVPVVHPPTIADTLSSSTRRVANVRALLASPPSSYTTNSIFLPATPPAALILSTYNFSVLSSGSPRNDAGAVIDSTDPILTVSAASAGPQTASPKTEKANMRPTLRGFKRSRSCMSLNPSLVAHYSKPRSIVVQRITIDRPVGQ